MDHSSKDQEANDRWSTVISTSLGAVTASRALEDTERRRVERINKSFLWGLVKVVPLGLRS